MCIITMRVCRIRAGAGDPMMNRTIGKNIFGIANEIEAHAWRVSRKFGKVFMAAPHYSSVRASSPISRQSLDLSVRRRIPGMR